MGYAVAMSNPSIVDFIDEVIAVVRDLPGIMFAPDDPPSQIAAHPAAVVWLTGFRANLGPDNIVEHHFAVRIGLITAMSNISVANQRILPQIEPVIEAIAEKQRTGVGFLNSVNIEAITGTYGPVQWGDVWYFGALIDLGDIKIVRQI